jgi:hypothetical protein
MTQEEQKNARELVNTLRAYSQKPGIKNNIVNFPHGSEKQGIKPGAYDLGELLKYLSDMIEE